MELSAPQVDLIGRGGDRLAEAHRAAVLAKANAGQDSAKVRGVVAAMEEKGLTVRSPLGDVHIAEPKVSEDPAEIGLCDVVLLCVKMWDTEPAAELIRPLLSHDAAAISLQNGVAAEDILSNLLGAKHVMGGVAQISAHIIEPGVIAQTGKFARILFGELNGSSSWRQDGLAAACEAAEGMEGRASNEIQSAIWRKLVLLSPIAGSCCLHRVSIGEIMENPDHVQQLEAQINETAAVGRAKGVALAPEVEENAIKALSGMPAEMKPSMLLDLESRRRLELDWLTGATVRLGKELGVETPASAEVYAALEAYALGAAS